MDLATGAMGALLPKLEELLKEEYKLQAGARQDVEFMKRELASMHPLLRKIGDVPRDQLDEQVKLWAGEVRELSYQLEDVADKFLVRVDGGPEAAANPNNRIKQLMVKARDLFKMWRSRRQISGEMKSIKDLVQEVAKRRDRYRVDHVVARPAAVDPRIRALSRDPTELVGIDGKIEELMKLLSVRGDVSEQKLKIVSVVGFGGLGKTTLVKTVYDKMKGDFNCCAFVPVGRNPDLKKVFRDILLDLDDKDTSVTILDERQLINKLQKSLENKRYLIVIDDIWDEKLWEFIKCAFCIGNNLGSRLITTTRKVSVSEACCSSSNDSIYHMKPLSDDDSQRLFNRRIFESETACPPEFQDVSRDILNKCGGVPLAIITIASLLASGHRIKSYDEWHLLLKSIGRGLTEDASMEEMQRILSFSYYDLPSHLKTCLLYLSIYPEDSEIWKDKLIQKWVAENFVQCGKQETNLFELGEAYFNELVNRSMIQPVYDDEYNIRACRVHDMVLDLICSLSTEENFATMSDGTEDSTSSKIIRRLSILIGEEDHQNSPLACSFVRSLTVFSVAPPLSSFNVLRVLDLTSCTLEEGSLTGVGKLVHLRYLGLAYTGIRELPAEVGELQFLLVLDLRNNCRLHKLPSSVLKLRRLICLHLNYNTRLPDGFGCLTSLEVLKVSLVLSLNQLKELGQLARLRELSVTKCYDDGNASILDSQKREAFAESVCSLHNLRSLAITNRHLDGQLDLVWERWVPPRHLRILKVPHYSSTVLPWIKRSLSHLCNLCELEISVLQLEQEDLRNLGRLAALRSLKVRKIHPTRGLQIMGVDGFHSVIHFKLFSDGSPGHIVFKEGALSKTERVDLAYCLSMAKDDHGNYDFDVGLGNLLSLRHATISVDCIGVTVGQAKEAEAAMRRVADVHPNHPSIEIEIYIPEGVADDEIIERR